MLEQMQLGAHLMEHKLVSTSQHGFLQKTSCATCRTGHLDTVTKAANAGNSTMVVCLDMKMAYSRISHRRLIDDVTFLGIAAV